MTGALDDEHSSRQADASTPWHHSTAKVLGASAAGLAAIGLIVTGVMFASRAEESPQAPSNFVDPSFSSMTSKSAPAATPTTATRINPPLTTDIDLLPPAVPPPGHPTESDTSRTRDRSTADDEESEENQQNEGDESPRTTRKRPRLNETRTLSPRP